MLRPFLQFASLTLYSSGCNTFHKLILRQEEYNQGWNQCNNR